MRCVAALSGNPGAERRLEILVSWREEFSSAPFVMDKWFVGALSFKKLCPFRIGQPAAKQRRSMDHDSHPSPPPSGDKVIF